MSSEITGLVVALADCGPLVPLEEFDDWYNNDHAPTRLTIPGVLTATRYQAIDGQSPACLALYDLASTAAPYGETSARLHAEPSEREKRILPLLKSTDRRTYELIGTFYPASPSPASGFPTKYVLSVGLEVTPEYEDEFNKWYAEEHMPMISEVPGWLRGRRYKLVGVVARGEAVGKKVAKYLAIHEFDNKEYAVTEEYKQATTTPWREKLMEHLVAREFRVWEMQKVFEKPA